MDALEKYRRERAYAQDMIEMRQNADVRENNGALLDPKNRSKIRSRAYEPNKGEPAVSRFGVSGWREPDPRLNALADLLGIVNDVPSSYPNAVYPRPLSRP